MKAITKPPLPAGWRWTTMSEFLTHTSKFFIIEDNHDYQLVTVKLHGKGVVPRSIMKGAQIKTKEQQQIYKDQFLVAEIDAKFGGFGIVPSELDGAIVSGHYFLYDIDKTKVLPNFLQCFISSGILTKSIQKDIQGALNYSAIRPHHILEVPFPLPEDGATGIQPKIASHFAQIKHIQIYAERQLDAAIALERATMKQYFDFEIE
jgi:type I restriction enzyme, S subunit